LQSGIFPAMLFTTALTESPGLLSNQCHAHIAYLVRDKVHETASPITIPPKAKNNIASWQGRD